MGWKDWLLPPGKENLNETQAKNLQQSIDFLNKNAETSKNPIGTPKLFENRLGLASDDFLRIGFYRKMSVKEYAQGSFSLVNAMINMWTDAVTGRRNYIVTSAELRRFYIVNAILDLMTGDVLNSDDKGDIVELQSKDPKIQKALDKLCEKIDFNVLIKEITKDLIDLGEYSLRMDVREDQGLVGLYDDVDPLNLLAFYEQGVPSRFLLYKDGDWVLEPAYKYAHFVLGSNKMRLQLEEQSTSSWAGVTSINTDLPKELRDKLPDYVRVGVPLFMGVIPKIRELQLLEQLIPATKLNQLTQTNFISLNVPADTAPNEVITMLQRYEALLNVPTGVDLSSDQISLAEIMSVTGKIRVIPNFSDGKGSLTNLDLRAQAAVDDILNSVKDIRSVILSSIGIPSSLLFGSEDPNKANELRSFSRYTRKLAEIQQALAKGLKQIILAHLVNVGVNVTQSDFEVVFRMRLTDISAIEGLEMLDANQEIIGRLLDFVDKMVANPIIGPSLNAAQLLTWLQSKFGSLTSDQVIFKSDPATLQKIALLIDKIDQTTADNGGEMGGGSDPETNDPENSDPIPPKDPNDPEAN